MSSSLADGSVPPRSQDLSSLDYRVLDHMENIVYELKVDIFLIVCTLHTMRTTLLNL
jgi:hypothetical protein